MLMLVENGAIVAYTAHMFTTQTHRTALQKAAPLLAAGGTLAGGWLLFLHLMQNNSAFAETVGRISPDLASQFSCSCPFCNRTAACSIPEEQIGVRRLDAVNLQNLLQKN